MLTYQKPQGVIPKIMFLSMTHLQQLFLLLVSSFALKKLESHLSTSRSSPHKVDRPRMGPKIVLNVDVHFLRM